MAKKIFAILVLFMSAFMAYAKNPNLRKNESCTDIIVSGALSYNETLAGGVSLTMMKSYPWFHYGLTTSYTYDGTSGSKGFFGANYRNGGFLVGLSAGLGLATYPRHLEYTNTQGDVLGMNIKDPCFTYDGTFRVEYIWDKLGIYGAVSYTIALPINYSIAGGWANTADQCNKNMVMAEFGLVIRPGAHTTSNGDNRTEWGAHGGYSLTKGVFAGGKITGTWRPTWSGQVGVGGVGNYFWQTGEAEIGPTAEYEFRPGGSNGVFAIKGGGSFVFGRYRNIANCQTVEKPGRVSGSIKYYVPGVGGFINAGIVLTWASFEFHVSGEAGVTSTLDVYGHGSHGFTAEQSNTKFDARVCAGFNVALR
jgi:hypothetical protein